MCIKNVLNLSQVCGGGGNLVGAGAAGTAGAAGGGNVPVVLKGFSSFKNTENQNHGIAVKSTDKPGKDTQLSAVD